MQLLEILPHKVNIYWPNINGGNLLLLGKQMQALFRIGRGVPPLVPDSLSADARDFILQCLQVNPSARPTASQLLDHPFVKRPLSFSSGSSSPYNFGRRI